MSLKRFDGELIIDNRAAGTPALPEAPRAGNFATAPTIGCKHCGGIWRKNLRRIRPREYCKTCNLYICDGCAAVSKKPGYVHRTIDDLTEMVISGRYAIVGGTVCDPILIPIGAK